ncbi:hypothetical protein [Longimicrobium sp.]|uniref:hypothetical protein n=1 Tax=Longimicrobium sp. TaxID=2029185 RepID=UPI002E310127|nr:hypothetical protein [Longimicrobium sp.]HEX6041862.1 hypothetical protein [Longimicrobium sp.]
MDRDEVLRGFAAECGEDYVGLWQLARALPADLPRAAREEEVVSMVKALLGMGGIRLGQFHDGEFCAWNGAQSEQLERLRGELAALGRDPDIGEVAWLTRNDGAASIRRTRDAVIVPACHSDSEGGAVVIPPGLDGAD